MANKIMSSLKLMASYSVLHFKSAMEYRRAFIIQVAGMMVNNIAFIILWTLFFKRFDESFRGREIGFEEVILLFSAMSTSYGVMAVFLGGAMMLSDYIINGQLDSVLTLPRSSFFLASISKSFTSGWGDFFFGYIALLFLTSVTIKKLALFALLTSFSGVFLACFIVLLHSITFFVGNAEHVHRTVTLAVITFGTYPENVFSNQAKFLLYSLLPVGFYVYLPVRIILDFNLRTLGIAGAGFVFFVALSTWVFRLGLRRYESGSLFYSLK